MTDKKKENPELANPSASLPSNGAGLGLVSLIGVSLVSVLIGYGLSKVGNFKPVEPELERKYVSTKRVPDVELDRSTVELLGQRGALLFRSLDLDSNKIISAHEFGPVVERLVGEVPPVLESDKSVERGAPIKLSTSFEPFKMESTKMFEDEGPDGLMRNYKHFEGLRMWLSPHESEATFYSGDFRPFLPKTGDIQSGRPYFIYQLKLDPWKHANSGKYYPPTPTSDSSKVIYRLASLFHRNAFIMMRFEPHGTAAVVQASNDQYYNIRIRMHVEFQLNEPPALPFWYTPAQFKGNLVISKDGQEVKYFHLYLPNDRLLNIDMEWLTALGDEVTNEGESMEVEIGYQKTLNISSHACPPKDIEWTNQMSDSEADSLLEKTFYSFKQVEYVPLSDAFTRAAAENKLIHAVVLWGSLDDQSC